jgi:hypothetical protein
MNAKRELKFRYLLTLSLPCVSGRDARGPSNRVEQDLQ